MVKPRSGVSSWSRLAASCLVAAFALTLVSAARTEPPASPPAQLVVDRDHVSTAPPCGLGCNPADETATVDDSDNSAAVVTDSGENGTLAAAIAFLLVGGATVWGLSQLVADRRRGRERQASDARSDLH